MNRLVLPVIAALLVLAVPGCAAEKTEGGGGSHKKDKFNVILDYFPNADHAGIYAAQAAGDYDRAGLDVDIKPPPDPSAPLKLLRTGQADVVISYEPELLLARDKGSDLVSVAALVQKPLTTLMTLDGSIHSPADLRGKRVGTAGIPYQTAYLQTILKNAGVDPATVDETHVGYNLVPAMLSRKVDATLGAFWNYEGTDLRRRGRKPTILRMEKLGVPTYNELIFVARRKDLRREVLLQAAALPARHRGGPQAPARAPGGRRRRAAEGRPGARSRAPDRRRLGDAAGVLPRRQGQAVRLAGPQPVEGLRRLDVPAAAAQAAAGRAEGADQRVPAGRGARAELDRDSVSIPAPAARNRYAPASPFHSP